MKTSKFTLYPYILIFLSVIISLIFVLIPSLMSLNFSLKSYVLSKPDEIHFVWFKNFIDFFKDSTLRRSILNTLYFLIFMIINSFLFSIIGALVLNLVKKGRNILLAILVLPWALPPVVNAMIWTNIFSPTVGALNGILFKIGMIDNYVNWMTNSFVTINIVGIVLLWKYLPLMIIIVLAALQTIPSELYEASRIDGADSFRCFLHITFPAIIPTLAIVLSISSIVGLNVFDEIIVITRFRGDTRSLAVEAYLNAFRFLNLGYGSTIAYILLILGALFSILYLKNLYREIK